MNLIKYDLESQPLFLEVLSFLSHEIFLLTNQAASMKATKLFLIFLLFQLRLQAQPEFAPASSEWYYDAFIGWGGSGIVKATYTQDTIINGLALKVIERTEPTFSGPITSKMLIHQSHDTIYQVYEDVTGLSFHFLFRNEMEIGETVSFPVLYSGGTFTVMDKEAMNVGGKTLVRYELTNQDTFTVNIYDVFGPQYGFSSTGWGPLLMEMTIAFVAFDPMISPW